VASPDGREGSVTIHADASVYAGLFDAGESAELELGPGRQAWVQIARGNLRVNGQELQAGDGAAITSEDRVRVEGTTGGEVLLFDLA
jgi:redox-sensitive bicupin YhaK (pirin superfamily)